MKALKLWLGFSVAMFLCFVVLLLALVTGFDLMNRPSTLSFFAGVGLILATLYFLPQISARIIRRTNEKQRKLVGAIVSSSRSDVGGS
jgi:tryptophan-rich sensory protein